MEKPIAYMQRRQERLDYRFAHMGGYPIGRVGIESANKWIGHMSPRRTEAWYVTNAE